MPSWNIPARLVEMFQNGSINITEMVLLSRLLVSGPLTARQIAAEIHVGRDHATVTLKRLEKLGVISTQNQPAISRPGLKQPAVIDNGLKSPLVSSCPYYFVISPLVHSVETRNQTGQTPLKRQGFCPQKPSRKNGNPKLSKDDAENMAKMLFEALAKKRKVLGQFTAQKKRWWAIALQKLASLGIEHSRITKALKWYTTNIGRPYVPKAYSAKSFVLKFSRIEDAIRRDKDSIDLDVSPLAEQMTKHLRMKTWPKNSERQLAHTIQLSLDTHKKVKTLLREAQDMDLPPKCKTLAAHIIKKMGYGANFVEQWMMEVWDDIVDWKGWNGELLTMALNPSSKRFDRMGCGWTADYGLDLKWWTKLREVLCEGADET